MRWQEVSQPEEDVRMNKPLSMVTTVSFVLPALPFSACGF
jgi:hypothetical protein